jgi:peptidoglycan/xylan/chitin deacetylase (PgdA/CDA1 family)
VHSAPALTALPSIRRLLSRLSVSRAGVTRLSGLGPPDRVALTFDDGPDPASTPRFVEALAAHGVRATFFLLSSVLAMAPELGGDLIAAGHEVAVHGWTHRNLLLRGPSATYREIARTRDVAGTTTGQAHRFFRPPYGALTAAAVGAARRLDLTPVLWTCWERDWTRTATPGSVLRTVRAGLAGGGTIPLHDSDCTSAPSAWQASHNALPSLHDECARRGWRVGPLGEHQTPRVQ